MRVSVFKTTTDDWYGSYTLSEFHNGIKKQMLVEVSFLSNIAVYDNTTPAIWITCVWGDDDCGMEFISSNEMECWTMFLRVIRMDNVNKDELKDLGFIYC